MRVLALQGGSSCPTLPEPGKAMCTYPWTGNHRPLGTQCRLPRGRPQGLPWRRELSHGLAVARLSGGLCRRAPCCCVGSSEVPWPRGGAAACGLVSSGPFSSARVRDAVHRSLHVGLVLGIAQDQALLPARQSPGNSDLDVNVVVAIAIAVDPGDAFPTQPNLLVCLNPSGDRHVDCLVQALGPGRAPRSACAMEIKRSEWMSAPSLRNTGLFCTLNVMKISLFPTGILTVWPSSTPAGTGIITFFFCLACPVPLHTTQGM